MLVRLNRADSVTFQASPIASTSDAKKLPVLHMAIEIDAVVVRLAVHVSARDAVREGVQAVRLRSGFRYPSCVDWLKAERLPS